MTGLLIIGVAFFWLLVSLYVSGFLVARVGWVKSRSVVGVIFFFVLLVLPVSDELVGGVQFYSICKADSKVLVDEKNITNKSVIYVGERYVFSQYKTAVPVIVSSIKFNEVLTGRTLAEYRRYHAEGGWLIKFLGISESDSPLLFDSGCAPSEEDSFRLKYNIKITN
jgi:hypothetical protein